MLTFPLDLTLNCCHGIIMVFQVMESWKIGKIENWKVKELIFEVDLTLHCCHFFFIPCRLARHLFRNLFCLVMFFFRTEKQQQDSLCPICPYY